MTICPKKQGDENKGEFREPGYVNATEMKVSHAVKPLTMKSCELVNFDH